MTIVNTISAFARSEASEAVVLRRPKKYATGPTMPPTIELIMIMP